MSITTSLYLVVCIQKPIIYANQIMDFNLTIIIIIIIFQIT